MAHGMVLLRELPHPNYLHDLQESGALRASVNFAQGAMKGMGMVYTAEPTTVAMAAGPICPPGSICDPNTLLNILENWLSIAPPRILNAFAFLDIEQGSRRAWAREVQSVAGSLGDGLYVAAGHLFGSGRYNAVVEVLADDVDHGHEALLALTDIEGVRLVHLHQAHAGDTRGMGTAAG